MITPAACQMLAELCRVRAGIRISADKVYLIESRLGPVARLEGYTSTQAFIERLEAGLDDAQVWATVAALANTETGFFRDPGVFRVLEDEVLPRLIRERSGRLRIWSAGCGGGQEVYSLAMALAETPLAPVQVEILATDLCERSLEKAQAGLYSQFEVQRGLPARRLIAHFENSGELFKISPRLQQNVRWRRINLTGDVAALGQFDLILCRHVLGGLDPNVRPAVLERLTAALAPQGRLVLAPGDAADGLTAQGHGVFAAPTAARAVAV
jgi:chemotaxis protein methyltransferase CheR